MNALHSFEYFVLCDSIRTWMLCHLYNVLYFVTVFVLECCVICIMFIVSFILTALFTRRILDSCKHFYHDPVTLNQLWSMTDRQRPINHFSFIVIRRQTFHWAYFHLIFLLGLIVITLIITTIITWSMWLDANLNSSLVWEYETRSVRDTARLMEDGRWLSGGL